jgi:NAD(P)-dependent dehydrogenase (short-subunit alcohol dehydrogenase family)
MSANSNGFAGRVAIVTGSGGGIGAECILVLTRGGAAVLVNDIIGEAAHDTAARITDSGGTAVANADPVARDTAPAILEAALRECGQVDILVNCAGVTRHPAMPSHFEDTQPEELDLQMETHQLGHHILSQLAFPHMRERRYGRVVNFSSNTSFGGGGFNAYAIAKIGMLGLMNAIALEGREFGIYANCLLPMASTGRWWTVEDEAAARNVDEEVVRHDWATPHGNRPDRGHRRIPGQRGVHCHQACVLGRARLLRGGIPRCNERLGQPRGPHTHRAGIRGTDRRDLRPRRVLRPEQLLARNQDRS